MGGQSEQNDLGPLVRERTLELKLKVLEQRLTLKLVAGLLGAQAVAHFSIPSSITVPAGALIIGKLLFFR